MLSPKRTMSQLIQLWAKDPERAARLASSGLSSMWGIREFAAGGKVVPFISRGVRDFRSDLISSVKARAEDMARKTAEYQGWQFEPGDRVMGDKGVYTILGRTWDTKHDRPMYRYETSGLTEDQEGWHRSMFDAEKAHQSLKKMTGPIKKAKGGSVARALRAMRGPDVPKKLSTTEIIKEPGGNWLSGPVERSLGNLKTHVTHPPVGQRIGEHVVTQQMIDDYVASSPDKGLNDWIDKQLTRYIKNDMGTARDPIRKMAEEGVLHVDPDQLNIRENWTPGPYSLGVLGQSPEARRWEGVSDNAIFPYRADTLSQEILKDNPWVDKLAPTDRVYDIYEPDYAADDLGFDHLVDELQNALNPASGLPENLLLKPRSLPRLSVPQAVQRVHEINKWREASRKKAMLQASQGPAIHPVKEYPEQGLRWVEIKRPQVPEDWEIPSRYQVVRPKAFPDTLSIYDTVEKKHITTGLNSLDQARNHLYQELNKNLLEEALKYEGDTMGHCVGGYCEYVASGKSRIFSLRDESGEPHVTIEVGSGPTSGDESYITQIKGKGNAKPVDKYLPAVQDFVKTMGPWSNIYDLGNTGLIKVDGQYLTREEAVPLALYKLDPEHRLSQGRSEYIPLSEAADLYFPDDPDGSEKDLFIRGALSGSGIKLKKSSGGSVMDPTWHMMNMIYG